MNSELRPAKALVGGAMRPRSVRFPFERDVERLRKHFGFREEPHRDTLVSDKQIVERVFDRLGDAQADDRRDGVLLQSAEGDPRVGLARQLDEDLADVRRTLMSSLGQFCPHFLEDLVDELLELLFRFFHCTPVHLYLVVVRVASV